MKWLKRTVAVVVLVVLLAAAALAWFASTERALAWLAESATEWTGGRLELREPRGSLLGPLAFERVRYRDKDTTIDARTVVLDWRPAALLARRISIKTVTAESMYALLQPGTEPARLPESLALPAPVAIDRARVANLRIESGDTVLAQIDVSSGLRANARRIRIDKLAIVAPAGRIDASAEIAAARPFGLSGTVTIATAYAGHKANLDAKLGGALERVLATFDAQAADAKAAGKLEIEPFAAQPLATAKLEGSGIDLAQWIAGAPRSDLSVAASAARDNAGGIRGAFRSENRTPGRITQKLLPLRTITSDFSLTGAALALRSVHADFGPAGSATGSADVARGKASLQLKVTALDLRALHPPLHETRLAGNIAAEILADRQRIDLNLQQKDASIEGRATLRGEVLTIERLGAAAGTAKLEASGRIGLAGGQEFQAKARFSGLDPAALGDYPSARLAGDLEASGHLQPEWRVNLRVATLGGNWRGAVLGGGGEVTLSPTHVVAKNFELRAGSNRLRLNGAFGAPQDRLDFNLAAGNLGELDRAFRGALQATGSLHGTREQPGGSAKFSAKGIAFAGAVKADQLRGSAAVSTDADRRIEFSVSAEGVAAQGVRLQTLAVATTGSLAHNETVLNAKSDAHTLAARLAGRWAAATGWSGTVKALKVQGPFPATLQRPFTLEAGPGRVVVSAARLDVSGGSVRLDELRWEAAHLTSRGAFRALPLKPLLKLAGPAAGFDTDLLLRGDWDVAATPRLNGRIAIARESGDIVLSKEPVILAQLSALTLDMSLRDDHATGKLALAADKLGRAMAAFDILPAPGAKPGSITGAAPVQLEVKGDIATLRPFNALFGTTALVDGKLAVDLRGTGTLAAPELLGTLTGDQLRIEVPVHGVNLRDGKFAAELTASALVLKELSLRGGEGRIEASGEIPRAEGQEARIKWRAQQVRLLARPDRKLVVDGEGTLGLLGRRLTARGEIRAREGRIEFAYRRGAELGEDVVVLGREKPAPGKPPAVIDADITLDFGRKFHIRGQGLDTGLEGRIRLATARTGALLSDGEVRTVHGTYTFLGQRLTIDRGRLIFQGPPHNPGLDVRAYRKLPQVEVGVELTGTVRSPQVRLTSSPPMSRGEQMAWLVLGHDLSSTNAADAALLQAAASTLGSSSTDAVPITRRFAEAFGLDDISMQGTKTDAGEGQVVAVGKRLSDRVYATIEQGLNIAKSLFRLEFIVTRSVSLRVESGTIDGVPTTGAGVTYGRSFD